MSRSPFGQFVVIQTHLSRRFYLAVDFLGLRRSEVSTFGYPLITKVGASLYDFCQYAQASDALIEVIGASGFVKSGIRF